MTKKLKLLFKSKKNKLMHTINIKGELIKLNPAIVMGILNITPDSFYAASRYQNQKIILEKAAKMLEQGVAILDIGGYSTRPQAKNISIEEEIRRLIPAIESISKEFPDARISADTFRSQVARAAIEAGAGMINDISGGNLDKKMFETVADLNVPYILMHSRGNPQTMQQLTDYQDIMLEMIAYFEKKIHQLNQLGVKDIIIDAGFGFAKTIEQNYFILKNMEEFKILDRPILVGVSRKSMIWKKLKITPQESLNATTASNTFALTKGATILRVHDVKEAVEIIELLN